MRNVKVSVEKPTGLDPQTLALVRIAVATATGDETKLRDRMIAARAVHVPPPWVDELLLQSFLNVGYPLALVAFGEPLAKRPIDRFSFQCAIVDA